MFNQDGLRQEAKKKINTYMCSFTAIHRQRGNIIKQRFLTLAKIAGKSRPIVHFKIDIQVGSSTKKKMQPLLVSD